MQEMNKRKEPERRLFLLLLCYGASRYTIYMKKYIYHDNERASLQN